MMGLTVLLILYSAVMTLLWLEARGECGDLRRECDRLWRRVSGDEGVD